MARTVLVTGVSRYLGREVAGALQADPSVERVVGVDFQVPERPLGRMEFVRTDPQGTGLGRVVADARPDTVVHLGLIAMPESAGGRGPMKENNVVAGMQLVAACQESASVRRLVVRSTSAVYGSAASAPSLYTEDMQPVEAPRTGYARDAVEVERYVRGLRRRRSDISVAVLRFVNFMGPGVDSPLTRYLRLPVVPRVLGHDPRIQFIHTDDGVEVIRRMAFSADSGVFNATARGMMLLSQCLRRAGRAELPVPEPGLRMLAGLARGSGLSDYSPEQLRLLCHGRGVDGTRLEETLAWKPRYSCVEAYDTFLAAHGMGSARQAELFDRLTRPLTAAPRVGGEQ
ncbi:NAD-dependent epimerase/dehydratase family protein [Allonocardiopsis opalescens]|uniref:UDP-glucose 4-epimerase n=1 Tax=Allonocardiopsis opalescens TaxID=1144618 RepID=A0A2T0Q7T0_9ACTN|nr:NAD-dependent epimerase/dehydratase family protein [Allonocardiopsis opalescens]PRX99874.1 UDP-glucose 4-epimerase [Allonocardiopsis opalescens]